MGQHWSERRSAGWKKGVSIPRFPTTPREPLEIPDSLSGRPPYGGVEISWYLFPCCYAVSTTSPQQVLEEQSLRAFLLHQGPEVVKGLLDSDPGGELLFALGYLRSLKDHFVRNLK
jgi:hypothetical protein